MSEQVNEWVNEVVERKHYPLAWNFKTLFSLSTCAALVLAWPNGPKGMTTENSNGTKGTQTFSLEMMFWAKKSRGSETIWSCREPIPMAGAPKRSKCRHGPSVQAQTAPFKNNPTNQTSLGLARKKEARKGTALVTCRFIVLPTPPALS